MDRDVALERLKKYCIRQDRCHQDVRSKLIELQVYGQELEEIMSELIQEDFLNEERYARSYVRGKFRINKWGKNKIYSGLKAKRITDYCIRKGMEEIAEEAYRATIYRLLEKKLLILGKKPRYQLFKKMISYGVQKGYSFDLVKEVSNEILDHQEIV